MLVAFFFFSELVVATIIASQEPNNNNEIQNYQICGTSSSSALKCYNGGVCEHDPGASTYSDDSLVCVCQEGWTGLDCKIPYITCPDDKTRCTGDGARCVVELGDNDDESYVCNACSNNIPTTDSGCSICGPGRCIQNADAIIYYPGESSPISCGELQTIGLNGTLALSLAVGGDHQCTIEAFANLIDDTCNCRLGILPRSSATVIVEEQQQDNNRSMMSTNGALAAMIVGSIFCAFVIIISVVVLVSCQKKKSSTAAIITKYDYDESGVIIEATEDGGSAMTIT